MIEGYDISAHQRETPDLAGVGFVFVRATYGADPDTRYAQHAAAVRAAGKVLGAYHFARPTDVVSLDAQYEAFKAAARDADLWVIDREQDGTHGIMTRTATKLFIARAHADGRRIGLYASESAFRDFGQDFAWVANWSREPAIPWDIWQWENGGADKIDNNRFRGTLPALLALGAPYDPWVEARVAALALADAEVARLEAEVARLTSQVGDIEASLAAANARVARANESLLAVQAAMHILNTTEPIP